MSEEKTSVKPEETETLNDDLNTLDTDSSASTQDHSDKNENSTTGDQCTIKKASHRASERRRRERLSASLGSLETIIRSSKKFSSRKGLKLNKNLLIEYTIDYIKDLEESNPYTAASHEYGSPSSTNSNPVTARPVDAYNSVYASSGYAYPYSEPKSSYAQQRKMPVVVDSSPSYMDVQNPLAYGKSDAYYPGSVYVPGQYPSSYLISSNIMPNDVHSNMIVGGKPKVVAKQEPPIGQPLNFSRQSMYMNSNPALIQSSRYMDPLVAPSSL
ncbi:hypothetical protein WA158_000581 [Blastocystis sp. Blastoise]